PNLDDMPVHPSILKPNHTVFDTVYTPETTLLVKEARERGCRVLTGVDMFIRQAAMQFKLFTGKDPPVKTMVRALKQATSPVTLPEEED
ncbi:MAG: shikimate dehydrogenase, partial [Planctomycetes bacterium]|nr:shikimate dehydrogenase [Planctomycetota bacterium]